LASADETIALLREKEPALASADDSSDGLSAAERKRKHDELAADLAAYNSKVQQVKASGKKLIESDVRTCRWPKGDAVAVQCS